MVVIIGVAIYLVSADFKICLSSSFLSAILLGVILWQVYSQLTTSTIIETYENFDYRPMNNMGNIPIAPSFSGRCENVQTTSLSSSPTSPPLPKIDVSLFDSDPFNPTYVTANNVNTYVFPNPPDGTPDAPVTGCEAKYVDITENPDSLYYSINQNLVGPENPKTHFAPVVPPRLYEETWSKNDRFFVNRGINDQKQQEYYQNGYISYADSKKDKNQCCPTKASSPNMIPLHVQENFEPLHSYSTSSSSDGGDHGNSRSSGSGTRGPEIRISDDSFAPMNLSWGYFPEHAEQNLAVNYPRSSNFCATDDYNRQIRTTPLQPGLVAYSEVDVNDANMSNLGISYTQPFLPTKLVDLAGTDKSFYETDPFWRDFPSTAKKSLTNYESAYGLDPIQPEPVRENYQNHHPIVPRRQKGQRNRREYREDYSQHGDRNRNIQGMNGINGPAMMDRRDIYDPRLTGYGTSYRGYTDPMSGQPRYFYDDVDAHTQYNYITKSKIDHLPRTSQCGPYQPPAMNNMETRRYAEEQFLNQTLQQRTELQDRLMQKVLHRNIQRHQAPIMTRNTGSMNMTCARG
ncbi:MAG: hypothetical protein EBR74_04765 [Flavobacteriia bacterium]|nr:hypothetical protein [Flavobacteriia bacterium]